MGRACSSQQRSAPADHSLLGRFMANRVKCSSTGDGRGRRSPGGGRTPSPTAGLVVHSVLRWSPCRTAARCASARAATPGGLTGRCRSAQSARRRASWATPDSSSPLGRVRRHRWPRPRELPGEEQVDRHPVVDGGGVQRAGLLHGDGQFAAASAGGTGVLQHLRALRRAHLPGVPCLTRWMRARMRQPTASLGRCPAGSCARSPRSRGREAVG